MSTITTGSFPKLLWPGIKTIWGNEYSQHQKEYEQLFDMDSSDQAYEEDVLVPGFGLAPQKTSGASTIYDSHQQGYTKRYTHVNYSLGYIVTEEEMDDNLYAKVGADRTRSLAFSFATTKNIVGANVYNNGFDNNFTGGDGLELFSTAHTSQAGNQSNELATAADLSEAALEDLSIQIMKAKNDRGLEIALRPICLITPVDLYYEAQRILKSTLQSDSANNDINALKTSGIIPKIVTNHYLTDVDAFFIRTNIPSNTGMKCYQRKAISFTQDNDFDTSNFKAKAQERYAFGWTDWRGAFGSPGA